ncbi:MAG: hypothetical protein K9M99_01385 [Candidatus Cloacimonetes bacterium]|nr:hypothetical protein [Candidatus Cloacimonadota bacterium]
MKQIAILLLLLLILPCLAEVQNYDNIYLEYTAGDGRLAAELGEKLAADIGDFQKKIGHYPLLETHIIIAADQKEYESFLQSSSGIQEFSQAIYRHSTNTIYIRSPRDNLRYQELNKILLHEYIHSYVFHYFSNAPLWFHEGMAVYFSNDFSHNRELGLARDYLFGNTMPLSEMRQNYPVNRIEWESFYAKSALAVRYLSINKSGQFYRLWDFAEDSGQFNASFLRSFKYTALDFSLFFEEYCKTHFRSEIILALSGMIWLLFPLLFIIGYIRRSRKMRQKLAEMEAGERIEDAEPEFDFEIDVEE